MLFDCSSQFQVRSLNNELLSGHDLINQIVGVLTRFWENEKALKSDIESMFYQVRVSEEQIQDFMVERWQLQKSSARL